MRMIYENGQWIHDRPIRVKEYSLIEDKYSSDSEFVERVIKLLAIALVAVAVLTGELNHAIEYVATRIGGGLGGL